MKTEQTTIVYAQWDRWTSHDVIKHHIITISRLSIIFSLKSLLSLVKMEKSSKEGQ